jgi:hypothetical protein
MEGHPWSRKFMAFWVFEEDDLLESVDTAEALRLEFWEAKMLW